jgi:hypothetical protein
MAETINPTVLKEARAKKAADDLAVKERQRQQSAEWRVQHEAAAAIRAKSLLGEGLGAFIAGLNAIGHTAVILDRYRCRRVARDGTRDGEIYQAGFSLCFDPVPGKEATKVLTDSLQQAGFYWQLFSERHPNLEWSNAGDGGFVECGGYHSEHYILIRW